MTGKPGEPSALPDAAAELVRLLGVMARLRDPLAGCPWDLRQDFASIAPYTVEEAYEVEDAIRRPANLGRSGPNWAALLDELGDLLFQVVYHAEMAAEAGQFGFAGVARAIADKMVRRHPHVFAQGEAGAAEVARSAPGVSLAWEDAKAGERLARAEFGALSGVPLSLPALTRAAKLTKRAARLGFDWPTAVGVLDKLAEEAAELRAEIEAGGTKERLTDELGDLLFVLANLARKLDLDPEDCLRAANAKFERRFRSVEDALAAVGDGPADVPLPAMEALWQQAKRQERSNAATPSKSGTRK